MITTENIVGLVCYIVVAVAVDVIGRYYRWW